ncbi:QRFP-like peptide receptor [Aphidius gifuensis]|uniref:QRFP-like peptide receptor n=1 Tax=Aphidius gifuensis TaxID=684658 RepID=UPI001CDD0E9C|nr:QRFP-like peptide receptor [Aphidius gifuensis]
MCDGMQCGFVHEKKKLKFLHNNAENMANNFDDDDDDDFTNYTLTLNDSLEFEKMSELLNNFYNDMGHKADYVLIVLYVSIMLLALIANIMVILVVIKYQYMRSVTNYFVVNLSIADLLVSLICMPMAISQAVSIKWIYGETMCKLFYYLQGVAVAASVFTITAMSIDRYLAIRSPIALRRVFNRKSTFMIIIALWLIALLIFSPVLSAVTLQSPDIHDLIDADNIQIFKPPVFKICSEDFKSLGIHAHHFGILCFIVVYTIPGFIVLTLYSLMGRTLCARKPPFDCDSVAGSASSQQGFRLVRERKRVAWILLTLAIGFALCWLPYNALRLLLDLGIIYEGGIIPTLLSYFLFLGHANSALNPVVYCFMTRNFRRSVAELICHGTSKFNHRKSHRNNVGGVGVGSSVKNHGWNNRKNQKPYAVAALQHSTIKNKNKSFTSSSGYENSYDRHSPHRRCYMLKTIKNNNKKNDTNRIDELADNINKKSTPHRIRSSYSDCGKTDKSVVFDGKRSQSLCVLSSAVNYQVAYDCANQTTVVTNISQTGI